MAPRQAAGQEGAARRGARWLRVARREPEAAPGEGVDGRRRRPHGDAAAVAAEVPPAYVVEENDQDIGLLARARGECGELVLRGPRLVGEDESGLAMRGEADGRRRDRIERRHA